MLDVNTNDRPAETVRILLSSGPLCSTNVRGSDVCAWLDDLELAIVAFDASVAGATLMVRRLTQIAVAELEAGSGISWSAGNRGAPSLDAQRQDRKPVAIHRGSNRLAPGT